MKTIFSALFVLFLFNSQAQIRYVNQNATGNNNGTSWENAWTDLQAALQNTTSGDIWVAAGTYKATSGTDRETSLEVEPNVNLYGGFPDAGNPTFEQRDWKAFPTILSGDIGVENDTSDNTYQIMTLVSWSPYDNTIDGFIFTRGNSDYEAGGIDISGLFDFDSKVTIRNCTFRENYADYEGAAISASWTDLIIDNCVFEENYAGYEGGAISYFSDHFSTDEISLVCMNSIFRNNSADYSGGAVETRGYNYWYNCLFENNFADYEGGAMSHFRDGLVDVVNCTFVNNVTLGDGSVLDVFSWDDTVAVGASFSNCIFSNNIGNGLLAKGGAVDSIMVQYSFLEFCPPDAFCEDGNIFDSAPGFLANDDYHLMSDSPCINAGGNELLPQNITTDLDGNIRIYDGQVDIGAYEFGGVVSTFEAPDSRIAVFPNPASDFVQLDFGVIHKNIRLQLINASGQQLGSLQMDNVRYKELDISALAQGIYFLVAFSESDLMRVKIVKK